jgi:bacterioferritin
MKTKKPVLTELNKVLGIELIAINQYFLHARILKNWGLSSLAKNEFKASIESMKEADKLIERILFLEGLPNLQDLGKLSVGENVPEVFLADLTLETSLRGKLAQVIESCERDADFVSRELLTRVLEESEKRIDFIETQQELIKKTGVSNYIQLAAKEISDN